MCLAMTREIHIRGYFSLPTDLAAQLCDWPEYVEGKDYDVEMKSIESGETVTVRFTEDEDGRYVAVSGLGVGLLFDKVLGRVIYALSAHSDSLLIDKNV
jgi:hypothetical protein